MEHQTRTRKYQASPNRKNQTRKTTNTFAWSSSPLPLPSPPHGTAGLCFFFAGFLPSPGASSPLPLPSPPHGTAGLCFFFAGLPSSCSLCSSLLGFTFFETLLRGSSSGFGLFMEIKCETLDFAETLSQNRVPLSRFVRYQITFNP
ncbi:hypothetical protein SO802_020784 [Lithocarpus litseifolius]|uniref:Uncharacterized protein n=1 Tax=Lithocarpus litseifolius TaxID=425828 RepID=A0AAW2CDI5_9ROSI